MMFFCLFFLFFFLQRYLHFMHAFRGFLKHHLFFHSHLAGHPNTARYIFLCDWTLDGELPCWCFKLCQNVNLFIFCCMSTFFFFHRFCLSHGWYKLLGPPHCLVACIYPLDGFMCVLSGYPTVVFEETKANRSVFCFVLFFWKLQPVKLFKWWNLVLPLCGMYFLLDLWHNWHPCITKW